MNSLFEKVGFIKEYREEYTEFYRPYFYNEEEMNSFFVQVFRNDELDKTPRRMMNQIQRLVSLANDIEIIRPGRDALSIVFIRTCIESLCKLANREDSKKETVDKKQFWSQYIDFNNQQYILDNFVFSRLEPSYEMDEKSRLLFDEQENYKLTIDEFGMILFKVRGMAMHEGDYWTMQFFSRDNEAIWLTSIVTDEPILECYKPEKGKDIMYHFETTLDYDTFIRCFVRGCICYVLRYIEGRD